MAHKRHWGLTMVTMRMLFWCILTLLRAEGHEEGEGERRAGDFVGTHNENDGLQDGRHDRFPCTKEPQVIPWDNAHVFKINHEPFTDEKKVFVRKGEVPPLTQVSVADFKDGGYFEAHDHEDMFEIFYVLNGSGKFAITERGIDGESWRREEIKAEARQSTDSASYT
ncbi:unnamed protein product [Cladocopium goreaui]|uniref:Cupin type-1 domain-containing protein n=1 Tax=Cladocopium goreaui TaxID=2562237 RepID=A0A9P1FDW3_9DINO|nr:unnamed protein product [Cladocopium goreaui]